MKNKIVAVVAFVFMVTASLASTRFNGRPINGLEEVFITTNCSDSEFDARKVLGEDILRQLESASDEAIVTHNGLTGETTITEIAETYSKMGKIEPHIPEGVEVVELSAR